MNNKNIVFHIGNVQKPQIKEVQFPTLDNFGLCEWLLNAHDSFDFEFVTEHVKSLSWNPSKIFRNGSREDYFIAVIW